MASEMAHLQFLFSIMVLLFGCLLVKGFHIHSAVTTNRRFDLVMRERKCDLAGTRKNSKAMSVSKSNVHTHRTQNVNLQTCRLWWQEGNKFVRLRISTRTLKTIKKNGLHRTAKKFGVDLNKFSLSSGTAPPKPKQIPPEDPNIRDSTCGNESSPSLILVKPDSVVPQLPSSDLLVHR